MPSVGTDSEEGLHAADPHPPLAWRVLETPLGPMCASASERGIRSLAFGGAQESAGASAHLDQLGEELRGYFAGSVREFRVPLDWVGTPFQCRAWAALCRIPFGKTRSYAAQARQLGDAKATRAVGAANGRNRIAIVVPCHRVISADGTLGGYAGGVERKEWLLRHEGWMPGLWRE